MASFSRIAKMLQIREYELFWYFLLLRWDYKEESFPAEMTLGPYICAPTQCPLFK